MAVSRYAIYGLLGLGVMLVGATALLGLLGVDPDGLAGENLTRQFLPYRLVAYTAIVALWPYLARWIATPRGGLDREDPAVIARWDSLTDRLRSKRWSLAAFFLIFELLVV